MAATAEAIVAQERALSVAIVLTERRDGHSELECAFKILENVPPVALIAGTPSVTLVHDYQIEEILRKISVQSRSSFIPRDSLIGREVHLATLYSIRFYLPPSIAKRSERLVFWVVNQNIPIGEIQNTRTPVLSSSVPA